MQTRYTHRNVTWIDLQAPTTEEVRAVMEEFSLHPHVAEELLLPTLKPRVESFGDYLYLILHFPAFKHTHTLEHNQEVDFVIGKNFLITTRYDTIDPLHKFSKLFEVDSVLDKNNFGEDAGIPFFHMLRKLYGAIGHELECVSDNLIRIECGMFQGHEREMVIEISRASRDLLNFKQSLAAHKDVLAALEPLAVEFFGSEYAVGIRQITSDYYRLESDLRSAIEVLTELRETNNSLVSTKQNEVMKTLTIMAFVTFPLTLVSSLFAMDTIATPLVGHPFDFWIILGIMAALMASFFAFFRHKGWI
jgi:magnesium transporter